MKLKLHRGQLYFAILTIVLLVNTIVELSKAFSVPAPRIQEKPTIVGEWEIDWGMCHQVTTFMPDGTCSSPQFGKGTWYTDDAGVVYFGECNDTNHYAMQVSLETGKGEGARICENQESWSVDVVIKRVKRPVN